MIRVMRNISVRLWLTLLVSVPAGFYFLPWFTGLWTGPGMIGFFFCLSAVCYGGLSMVLHLTGVWIIQKRIQEAQAWEQAGIPSRAEKKYLQAVRTYDSFLLSPVRSRKLMLRITRSLARFALTFDRKSDLFDQAVRVCLTSASHDDALAALWLKQLRRETTVTPQDHALLTRLAHTHQGDPGMLPLLARIFLDAGRMDFAARQVYAQVMDNPDLSPGFQQEIEGLTGGSPRTMAPFSGEPVQKRRHLNEISEKKTGTRTPVSGMSEKIRCALLHFQQGIGTARRSAALSMARVRTGMPGRIRWRFYLKAGIMGAGCIGMAVLIHHTVFYLKAPEPVTETDIILEERPLKPFTIQVAAYLTETHAGDYVDRLSRKGVDARIKTTTGGGKTWYLIHVSEFEDRQSAAAYGNRLISENIIEEFFVSNKQ
jgi:hypothetical protein